MGTAAAPEELHRSSRSRSASSHGNASQESLLLDRNSGIIPRVIDRIFKVMEQNRVKHQMTKKYSLKVSFIELYNEQIIDLLNPNGSSNR